MVGTLMDVVDGFPLPKHIDAKDYAVWERGDAMASLLLEAPFGDGFARGEGSHYPGACDAFIEWDEFEEMTAKVTTADRHRRAEEMGVVLSEAKSVPRPHQAEAAPTPPYAEEPSSPAPAVVNDKRKTTTPKPTLAKKAKMVEQARAQAPPKAEEEAPPPPAPEPVNANNGNVNNNDPVDATDHLCGKDAKATNCPCGTCTTLAMPVRADTKSRVGHTLQDKRAREAEMRATGAEIPEGFDSAYLSEARSSARSEEKLSIAGAVQLAFPALVPGSVRLRSGSRYGYRDHGETTASINLRFAVRAVIGGREAVISYHEQQGKKFTMRTAFTDQQQQ